VESSRKSLDPWTLAKLQGLRLRARRIVEGYLGGSHRSPYRGFSIEFAEHREYAPGDDLRHLDWKVYARTDKLYLKQFQDETNLICHLVVDVSESMAYRGPDAAMSKFEYAQCLGAALAWLVLRQRDAVGLVTLDDRLRDEVPASSNPAHLEQIVRTLETSSPNSKTKFGSLLSQLAGSLPRRGIVVLISDLFDDVATLLRGLQRLRLERHEVITLQVLDRTELDFPFEQPTLFRGLEQFADMFVDPQSIRESYRAEMRDFCRALQRGCHENQISFTTACTDQPLDRVLAKMLAG
jgi:uncharacterized protein (DUF58 family)